MTGPEPSLPVRPEAADAAAPAAPSTPEPARLLEAFLELMAYTLVLLDPAQAHGPAVVCDQALEHYLRLLRRAEAAKRRHGYPDPAWQDALFAVCAWVDERILCSAWDGRGPWVAHRLQRRLFGTTRAGEQFYPRLEAALDRPEVLEVYVTCLCLGFQGQYFGPEGEPLRAEVLARAMAALPAGFQASLAGELFPEAGQASAPARRRTRIPFMAWLFGLLFMLPPLAFGAAWWRFHRILDGLVHAVLP